VIKCLANVEYLRVCKEDATMNRTRLFAVLVILSLLTGGAIAPPVATARAVRTEVTGEEWFADTIDPGELVILPNGRQRIRGLVNTYTEVASDPRLCGWNTIVINANWDAYGVGPMWGTAHLDVPAGPDCHGGGAWDSTWTGAVSADGSCYWRAVGHGTSGCVEGLKLQLIADCGGYPTTYEGTVLAPHGE
jgi:hypothetical protein